MDRKTVLETMKGAAKEVLSLDADAFVEGARFKEDLDADSLDLVELLMVVEEKFGIAVPEESLEDVRTVGQALDAILAAASTST